MFSPIGYHGSAPSLNIYTSISYLRLQFFYYDIDSPFTLCRTLHSMEKRWARVRQAAPPGLPSNSGKHELHYTPRWASFSRQNTALLSAVFIWLLIYPSYWYMLFEFIAFNKLFLLQCGRQMTMQTHKITSMKIINSCMEKSNYWGFLYLYFCLTEYSLGRFSPSIHPYA